MMMVSKQSPQVWLLLIFTALAFCSYNTEMVAANHYCPAGNLEGFWASPYGCNLVKNYRNCPQWCQDHGKTFATKFTMSAGGGLVKLFMCICCCGEPEPVPPPPPPPPTTNKWCPPGDIERIWVTNICGFDKDFENCGNWCRAKGRSFETKQFKRPSPDYDLVDCVCCCGDALAPPPSSTGSSLSIAAQ